ncbi:GntR family transcriptional regulator [Labrys monachus]|uniref:DNA-binding GntR family transcriptional regulator n=1 Tax=Labrys monachus TaxID=217067 RepID=A0ABU0FFR9_9HYPH|nr:GntR family transcriptional regulator [Labrys monachus]MDQ0392958.1 DNA-binding GntR family transcriptional regulator [Labrys monachus]
MTRRVPRPSEEPLARARAPRKTARVEAPVEEAPLETTSLADEIAFRLQAAIVARTLRPGERLRQEELCRRFNVSRTPVREALRKLQALQLVTMVPNRGTIVRVPTRHEIVEVYDLRAELEGYAARCACARASTETDRALAAAMGTLRRRRGSRKDAPPASDPGLSIDVSVAVRGFHHIIQDCAGNERLVRMIRDLETSFPGNYCCHEIDLSGEAKVVQVDEHDAIRAAIRARDGAAAQQLMRDHILHSKQLLLAHMDEHGVWFAEDGEA